MNLKLKYKDAICAIGIAFGLMAACAFVIAMPALAWDTWGFGFEFYSTLTVTCMFFFWLFK